MTWPFVFSAANLLAMAAWAMLLLLPRRPLVLALVLYLGVGLLCLAYAVAIIGLMGGFFDPVGPEGPGVDFTTLEGVQSIFATQGGATIGWIHYLAFDLFVGLWIARDADAKGFSRWLQAPILLATFMAGPIGLIVWLIVRDRRARAQGRWS